MSTPAMAMRLTARRPNRRVVTALAVAWTAVVFLVVVPNFPHWISDPSGGGTAPAANSPLAKKLAGVRLMNYYPATAAWTYMWTRWNLKQIDADFAKIEALGANAVRLNIEPGTFGFPTPSTTMIDELDDAIQAARAHSLAVQLTLFDWWSGYTDTQGSDEWVDRLLTPYNDDAEIAFIDIKNEIDPNDAAAMRWLVHELPIVQHAAGSVPVTVSVTGPNVLGNLATLKSRLAKTPPDFYDVHYYDAAETALATFEAAKALVSPLPLFIGESGETTGSGSSTGIADAGQDLYLRTVEWAAHAAGLPDAAPWIFQDLASSGVPPQADEAGSELDFGLYRLDGAAKPAATSIEDLYQHAAISTDANGDFSIGDGTSVSDWTPIRTDGATLEWDDAVGHDGPGSVLLSHTKPAADGDPAYLAVPVVQPTAAGQTFELTAWAEGVNATGDNRIAICWFSAAAHYLGESDSPILIKDAATWHQLSVTSAAPSGAAYDLIYLESGGNNGTVYFDDVTLTELGGDP
jgi:hypothetical protein